jgi:hypothetical protein
MLGRPHAPEMRHYADTMTLLAARAAFFEEASLGVDGGYGARWVRVEAKPFPFFFPNSRGRVAAAKLHDLHHVATEYRSDWVGEAEIAAWEIAGGCGPYGWAWLLNAGAFAVGLFLAPRRVFRAFVRGRGVRNLYHRGFAESALESTTVGSLRRQLGLDAPRERRPSAVASFATWSAIVLVFHAAAIALGVGLLWAIWRSLRR